MNFLIYFYINLYHMSDDGKGEGHEKVFFLHYRIDILDNIVVRSHVRYYQIASEA